MRPRLSCCPSAALAAFILLPAAAQAQLNPFPRRSGPVAGGQPIAVRQHSAAECSRPPKPDDPRRGATRRRTPPAPPPYSGCSARMAWPAIWCAITSSSRDSPRVAITGSLGAAHQTASGRSKPNWQIGFDHSPHSSAPRYARLATCGLTSNGVGGGVTSA